MMGVTINFLLKCKAHVVREKAAAEDKHPFVAKGGQRGPEHLILTFVP
jgi:hypothetical protein